MKVLELFIEDFFAVLYEQTGFSLLVAILFMFFYLYVKEHGGKVAIRKWLLEFKRNGEFRRLLVFVYYLTMLGFRTLFNRNMWMNPLSDLLGGWGLYDKDGAMTSRAIENVVLFVPLALLLFWACHQRIFEKKFSFWLALWKSCVYAFGCSFVIECCQLFFRIGTFQFSDLCYNTLGGVIGGILYWGAYKVVGIFLYYKMKKRF